MASHVGKGRAVEAKELGNRAFGAKNFEEALQHFNTCIQLDPQWVFFILLLSASFALFPVSASSTQYIPCVCISAYCFNAA